MAQSESHCEIVRIYVVTLLQLARSLRSLARCDCARFARVTHENNCVRAHGASRRGANATP